MSKKSPLKKVIISFLGSQLDAGMTDARWRRWRPSVALAQDSLGAARVELLLTNKEKLQGLAERVVQDMGSLSPELSVRSHDLAVADPWDFPSMYAALADFARGYDFREDEEYFVHLSTGTHVAQICLFLLTESKHLPARLLGSYPMVSRSQAKQLPEEMASSAWKSTFSVIDLDLTTYDQLASRFGREQLESESLLKGGIETRSRAFNELISRIEKVSVRSTEPVLLMGPTGAGKTALAGRIYELRHRRHLVRGAFVEVNCATLTGDNAMSTLFGHKKGAFTGAVSDREGLLKAADAGVLMLDEIGTLGLDEQAMLLRALEDKRFFPLGSDKEVSSDFQLVAGTNCDLVKEVARGRFRADLLARISLWSFTLPGLSSRREDIEPNLDHELGEAGARMRLPVSMNQPARARYLAFAQGYSWPGNFRDLRASVVRMATLADGGRITLEDVEQEISTLTAGAPPAEEAGLTDRLLGAAADDLDLFDRAQLEVVLKVCAGAESLAQASRALFAESRKKKASSNDSHRLRIYLERFDLDFKRIKAELPD